MPAITLTSNIVTSYQKNTALAEHEYQTAINGWKEHIMI